MIDLQRIRQDPEAVRAALLKRMDEVDFSELLEWDEQHRAAIQEVEELKARRNKVSDEIPVKKKAGEDVTALLDEMKYVSASIKELDAKRTTLHAQIQDFLDGVPNIPADNVVAGGKENNEAVRTYGTKPAFSFEPRDHVELATSLGLVDYERGAKLGGNGFWLYTGMGARLEWALLNFFIEEHLADGYEFVLPPHILSWECGYTAGQFPKFDDNVYYLEQEGEEDNPRQRQFILPTAETALINVHRDEILLEEQLPKKYFAYSPCYRKEAGSYRTSERGMIRGHQFNKVEMFIFCTPAQADSALSELIGKAERVVEKLGLHFQVSKLAARDCSEAMAQTYDIEIWIPSIGEYKEVSSASNAADYQARRGNMRFKPQAGGKNQYIHSLNASGLATSRLVPALLEQNQNEDGSVTVPEVLRSKLGVERLEVGAPGCG